MAFRSVEPHRWQPGAGNRDVPRGRPPQQATGGNPLESLSLDIGRLMDRNLAAEMWDRYQRGESKAFSKRLYTPAGQKAFDEVARKYRADRTFKQTVDRYITEFERLLDEVAARRARTRRAARPPHLGDRPRLHPARACGGTARVRPELIANKKTEAAMPPFLFWTAATSTPIRLNGTVIGRTSLISIRYCTAGSDRLR